MKNIKLVFRMLLLGTFFFIFNQDAYSQIRQPYGNDFIRGKSDGDPSKFVTFGTSWDCRYVSYIFVNGTSDIAGTEEEAAVRSAMATWSAVTNIDFIEACNTSEADIRISWEVGSHGDNLPFLVSENEIAHAFAPPPNAGALAGDIHFNEAELWTLNGDDFDLETVALHELGHSLGLDHTDVAGSKDAVMELGYEEERRALTSDDIAGVQSIYGRRNEPLGVSADCFSKEVVLEDFDCLPEGYTVKWKTAGSISIESGQGTGVLNISTTATVGIGSVTVTIDSGCDQIEFTKVVSLADCNDCCPSGSKFDGANCYFGVHFPEGYEGFVYKNSFYTKQNCAISTANDCCPPGSIFDGANCYFGVHFPYWYDGFVYNNSFYTQPNCESNCCPEGFKFDGENCYSGFHWKGVKGFIKDGGFYTTSDCQIYSETDCCPPGTTVSGADCYYGPVPGSYEGFVYENSFYTQPNCEVCCPDGSRFDGANCYFGVHFPKGYNGFVWNNSFYTQQNCSISTDNDCCPPGSTFDGVNCYFGVHFPAGFEGFVYNNSFYTRPVDCYGNIEDGRGKSIETTSEVLSDFEGTELEVYKTIEKLKEPTAFPNPSTGSFTIDLSSVIDEVKFVNLISVSGQEILTITANNLEPMTRIDGALETGVYFIRIVLEGEIKTIRVVKI